MRALVGNSFARAVLWLAGIFRGLEKRKNPASAITILRNSEVRMLKEAVMTDMKIDWQDYFSGHFYDELISAPGRARPETKRLAQYLASLSSEELRERKISAELAIKTMGISFTVYSDAGNIDREWPFDIITRIIPHREWQKTERGLIQRLTALNCIINDVYNEQKIIKDKIVPAYLLDDSVNFRRECIGMKPAYGVWSHVCGSD